MNEIPGTSFDSTFINSDLSGSPPASALSELPVPEFSELPEPELPAIVLVLVLVLAAFSIVLDVSM